MWVAFHLKKCVQWKTNLVQSICSTNSCHHQLGKNYGKPSVDMPQWQMQLRVLKEEKYKDFTMLKNSKSSPSRNPLKVLWSEHKPFHFSVSSKYFVPKVGIKSLLLSVFNYLELMRVMSKKVAQWEILCFHPSHKWGKGPTVCWALSWGQTLTAELPWMQNYTLPELLVFK